MLLDLYRGGVAYIPIIIAADLRQASGNYHWPALNRQATIKIQIVYCKIKYLHKTMIAHMHKQSVHAVQGRKTLRAESLTFLSSLDRCCVIG